MMLEAFILGFWAVWSADRDLYVLTESLMFVVLVALMRVAMDWELPVIDAMWLASYGLLWLYVALVFWLINRVAQGFLSTLTLACIGAVGYFFLAERSADLVAVWLGGVV